MRTVPYSAAKADLYRPWERGNYFSNNEARHTASLCAELSRLAYCRKSPSFAFDQNEIQSVLERIGFSQRGFFESPGPSTKGTHCFAAVGTDQDSGKQIGVVAFRGTDADDPTDIGDDADFFLKKWNPGGRVHTGFANALDQVEGPLSDTVKSIRVPILFMGHSLGAAVATLAASLYKATADVAALYTIGSPRVGNSEFVATLNGIDAYRYVDCCDLVARVPLSAMGYDHVGPARYIDRNGLISPDPSEATLLQDRAAAELDYITEYALKPGNVGVRDLADHAPINYVWAVAADGGSGTTPATSGTRS